MSALPPELAAALEERLRYYHDLGVHDFYRRCEPDPKLEIVDVTPTKVEMEQPYKSTKPVLLEPSPTASVQAAPVAPESDHAAALAAIREDLGECMRCPLATLGRHKIVFGDGDPCARLMFVGEGPGADEDATGLPFVGRAGKLLDNMIAAMGLKREQVYIANVVKCRPPKNRTPEPIEANTCMPFLRRQIAAIQPEVIVALGSTAATYLLGVKASLASLRGRIHDAFGAKLVVTYHPAYLLRDPRQKAEAWKDLQIVMKELGLKPHPTHK